MTNEGNGTERQAHLRDYWRTLVAGRRTIGAVFVIVLVIGIVATWTQRPVYRATATLEVSPRTQRVVKVDDVSQIGATGLGWSAEDRYFKTQLEVLRSRDVAERAFVKLRLKDDPYFSTSRDPVARFMSRIEVEPTPETVIVTVSMEGPDPERTAAWVNEVAQSYVDRNIEQANKSTADAIGSLLNQLAPLRENLRSRDEAMFKYARERKVYVPETQRNSYNERLASLERDYTETKLKRLELEAVFRKIEEIDRAAGDYTVIPQVARDEVLRALTKDRGELESEQRKLLVTLKPGHFTVRENEAALSRLTQRITAETNRIISAIRTDYALAQARELDLAAEIQGTQEESLDVQEKSAAYELLRTESTEAKRIYDLVAQRVKEVDLNSSLLRNNLSIIDRAIVPTAPVRPRKMLNLAVAMLMGLGLGIGMVFLLEYLDDRVRGAEQILEELGLNTLAIIPRHRADDPAMTSSGAPMSEAFASLRTAVQFSSQGKDRRVVLVTSPGPGEGKSLVALMLARSMARAGDRVALVDANLRSPRLREMTGAAGGPGLSEWLQGSASALPPMSPAAPGEPLLLAAGTPPRAPAELLGSERFAALLDELRKSSDWVVLDAPAVTGLADAALLAARADLTLVVARQGATSREGLRRAVEALKTRGAGALGIVLNDVDLRRPENRHLAYLSGEARSFRPLTRRRTAAL